MENYQPTQIRKTENSSLMIKWNDGKENEISLTKLRDECPCVNCKGESTPFKAAGFYEIESIEAVGNYAISIKWKDGHDTGIYSWDILRNI
jgi:DUF971 family protein